MYVGIVEMAEWRDGGMAGWRDGVTYPAILRYRKFSQMIRGMAEQRNGMAEWYGGTATYQLNLWYTPRTTRTTRTPFNLLYNRLSLPKDTAMT